MYFYSDLEEEHTISSLLFALFLIDKVKAKSSFH